MDFIDPLINEYAERFSSPESPVLSKLNRETNANILMPRMLSGHLQGRLLSMISKMIRPTSILEIGTFSGYSAICLAEGLTEDGLLHTIEYNDELAPIVKKYISDAGMSNKIRCYWGNAMEIIPKMKIEVDLVFIDADKENYCNYLDLVIPMLKNGGYIIADNVLWSGKVLQDTKEMDTETKALHEFNIKINNEKSLEHVLIPVRDGLMIIRKSA